MKIKQSETMTITAYIIITRDTDATDHPAVELLGTPPSVSYTHLTLPTIYSV